MPPNDDDDTDWYGLSNGLDVVLPDGTRAAQPPEPDENPFQISYDKNPNMPGEKYDLCLMVGALDSPEQCKQLGDALAEWLTSEGGWKEKVQ